LPGGGGDARSFLHEPHYAIKGMKSQFTWISKPRGARSILPAGVLEILEEKEESSMGKKSLT